MPTSSAAPIATAASTAARTLLTIIASLLGPPCAQGSPAADAQHGPASDSRRASLESPLPSRLSNAPQAVRHDGAALRERAVPHRPHHGVHPGRHLGALPADAGPRGAFRLRRRRARRADHARRRRRPRHHAAGARRARSPRRAEAPRRLPHQLRPLALDRLARERRAVAGHLPQAAQGRGLARHDEADRAVLRSGEGDVPAGPLHQGRVPEVRREGPVRRRLRELRLGQRADRSEESVLDAVGRDAGAASRREHFFFRLSDPRVRRVPAANGRTSTAGCSPRSLNKAQRVARATSDGARRSPTGTSRATRRTSASRSPTRPASISTSGSTRRSATSRA